MIQAYRILKPKVLFLILWLSLVLIVQPDWFMKYEGWLGAIYYLYQLEIGVKTNYLAWNSRR